MENKKDGRTGYLIERLRDDHHTHTVFILLLFAPPLRSEREFTFDYYYTTKVLRKLSDSSAAAVGLFVTGDYSPSPLSPPTMTKNNIQTFKCKLKIEFQSESRLTFRYRLSATVFINKILLCHEE